MEAIGIVACPLIFIVCICHDKVGWKFFVYIKTMNTKTGIHGGYDVMNKSIKFQLLVGLSWPSTIMKSQFFLHANHWFLPQKWCVVTVANLKWCKWISSVQSTICAILLNHELHLQSLMDFYGVVDVVILALCPNSFFSS